MDVPIRLLVLSYRAMVNLECRSLCSNFISSKLDLLMELAIPWWDSGGDLNTLNFFCETYPRWLSQVSVMIPTSSFSRIVIGRDTLFCI